MKIDKSELAAWLVILLCGVVVAIGTSVALSACLDWALS